MKIVAFLGSVRPARQGIRVARYIERRLTERGHSVTLIDPMTVQLPLLDLMYKEYPKGSAPPPLEALATTYRAADAFVVISAEYNHSIPPALSNLLDYFLEEYFWRPSAIVCYSGGQFGGVRAAMQLRAMLCELGMPSIPSLLPVPRVETALDAEGNPADEALDHRFARFAAELEWYGDALRARRVSGVPY